MKAILDLLLVYTSQIVSKLKFIDYFYIFYIYLII